ncbi:fimbrial protein [Pseudomonas edaphica]|nr:fimbrial protein [Pseudomonas edaphica]
MNRESDLRKKVENGSSKDKFRSAFSKVAVLALFSIGFAPEAFSTCFVATNGGIDARSLTLDGGALVTYQASVGSVIYSKTFTFVSNVSTPYVTCTGNEPRAREWYYNAPRAVAGYTDVVQTLVSGVGLRIRGPNGATIKSAPELFPVASGPVELTYAGENRLTFELIKLNPTLGAFSLRGITVPNIGYYIWENGARRHQVWNITWNGEVTAKASTCGLSNVNVKLGAQPASLFARVGDKSPAIPFAVNVVCTSPTPNIGIKIDPVFTTVNASNGVFSLDPSSTAAGLGVQLMADDGTPVNLDLPIKNSAIAATHFAFPLRAAFIRTGATVRSGSARSSLRTTITYQ